MILEFENLRLDFDAQRLTRNGEPIRLRRKTWDVLRYLSERPGRLVSREELAEAVWGDVVVTDEVVPAAVRELRRALGDHSSSTIETVRGRGFRFVALLADAEKQRSDSDDVESAAPTHLAGRADALQQLHDAWTGAERRR